MTDSDDSTGNLSVDQNSWFFLRRLTDARIGLGRAGVSIPTKHLLEFQLAHAKAQDAVHKPLDTALLQKQLTDEPSITQAALSLHSRATDRAEYLQRPDYGRLLNDQSAALLDTHRNSVEDEWDLSIVIVDGLSSLAIEKNAVTFLTALYQTFSSYSQWNIAPLTIVEQGRVAIGDDIATRLKARCVLILIGERPGLSSPDSMGLYLTWNPEVGVTDAYRNCISNIRPAGLSYQEAARRCHFLLEEARRKKLSGVQLKDRTTDDSVMIDSSGDNFLIGG